MAVVLAFVFRPTVQLVPWAVAAFIPAVLLAFLLRFLFEWTLALAAFWTTRVSALNQAYYVALLFLSGQVAPLSLFPGAVAVPGSGPALPLDDRLPARAAAGPADAGAGADRVRGAGGMDPRRPGHRALRLARRCAALLGGGRMNTLRLAWAFFRVGVMGEAAYRVNFVIQLFQSLLGLVTALGGLAVVFSYTDTLGGWRPDEVVALVGVYIFVGGLIGVVIQPSMEALIEGVHDGSLDFTLTMPEDAQLLASHPGRRYLGGCSTSCSGWACWAWRSAGWAGRSAQGRRRSSA